MQHRGALANELGELFNGIFGCLREILLHDHVALGSSEEVPEFAPREKTALRLARIHPRRRKQTHDFRRNRSARG